MGRLREEDQRWRSGVVRRLSRRALLRGMPAPARAQGRTSAHATHLGINHTAVIEMKIKRVVRISGVVGVALQGLRPINALTCVLDDGLALSHWGHCKHPSAVDAAAPDLNAPTRRTG